MTPYQKISQGGKKSRVTIPVAKQAKKKKANSTADNGCPSSKEQHISVVVVFVNSGTVAVSIFVIY